MNSTMKPLSHASVCFISKTPDAEKTIGYIARVSNPNNQDNPKVEKLLERILVYFIAGKAKCQKLPNGSEWLDTLLEDFKDQVEDPELTQLPEAKFK